MRKVVGAKLHGIHVTDANIDYHGSITLDPDHCEEAGILPLEFVEIWNKNSGARISTYVILGERGSRCCILNGAAARTCQPGDQIIICTSIYIDAEEIPSLQPEGSGLRPGKPHHRPAVLSCRRRRQRPLPLRHPRRNRSDAAHSAEIQDLTRRVAPKIGPARESGGTAAFTLSIEPPLLRQARLRRRRPRSE